jgi:hypothetical protein
MTCTQCKADLPEFATSCPNCGTAVPAVARYAHSYLPAGTPSWPSASQDFHGAALPAAALQAIVMPSAAESPPAKERPRRAGRMLSIIVLLLLSCVLGAGVSLAILWSNGALAPKATSRSVHLPSNSNSSSSAVTPVVTQTSGSSLPTPSSFKPMSSANSQSLGLTMDVPGDWQEGQLNTNSVGTKSLQLQPPQSVSSPLGLAIIQLPTDANTVFTGASDVNQTLVQNFGQANQLGTPKVLTNTPSQRTIGGVSWTEEDATFALNNNGSLHVVTITVNHDDHYYTLQFFASGDVFDEAMQKYYNPMLESLQFKA